MTNIEWTDATWNPVTGCTKVSAGCKHCYAETVAERFWAHQYPRVPMEPVRTADGGLLNNGLLRRRRFTDVQCHADRLEEPLHWRKPRRVFVNSMSDLFHEVVPDEFIDKVFGVMAEAVGHTFQILTKRPERMRSYLAAGDELWESRWPRGAATVCGECEPYEFPLSNVWLGVSAENQETADARIPILLDTPAAVRFVSAEPLLGPIDLGLRKWDESKAPWSSRWIRTHRPIGPDLPHLVASVCDHVADAGVRRAESNRLGALSVRTPGGLLGIKPDEFECLGTLDWIIVGGESGAGARPCDVAWIRSIVEQCKAAAAAVFVKQLGACIAGELPDYRTVHRYRFDDGSDWTPPIIGAQVGVRPEGAVSFRLCDAKGGDPSEWPEDLRVREFPEVRQ